MYNNKWESLNWVQIEETVFNIQHQIYMAAKARNLTAVRNLQNILLNMYEPRYLAVKTVTTNSGGKTPGIDKWIAVNDDDKFMIANSLVLDGTTNLVRRVYIPKPGTDEKRPLGIPTIIDRAKQCFVKFIIEPEFEALFEGNSYGFRPGRSGIDLVSKIRAHLIFKGPCYVLDADIKKCFDRINHAALIQRVGALPIISNQIAAWLNAGIFDKDSVIYPTEGTPQGGIISPLLANIALDGLQNSIASVITQKFGKSLSMKTNFYRYADDIVCFAPTQEIINEVRNIISFGLSTIGLELKEEKTRVVHTLMKTDNGKYRPGDFDFLGFRFKQRSLSRHKKDAAGKRPIFPTLLPVNNPVKTYVLVSPSRIERHKASISSLMKEIGDIRKLIETLNPRIVGWSNYFKNSDAKEYGDLPRKMDLWLNAKIRKWIRRTSKNRAKSEKFWKQDTKDWVLYYIDKVTGNEITLAKYNHYRWSIYDYKAINADFSPYSFDYKNYKKWQKGKLLG